MEGGGGSLACIDDKVHLAKELRYCRENTQQSIMRTAGLFRHQALPLPKDTQRCLFNVLSLRKLRDDDQVQGSD